MKRVLPSRPDPGQLKNQAKDLLKAHKRRDKGVCETLRLLTRFATLSDGEILSQDVALHEAQYALALSYGFPSWNALKKHVEAARKEKPPALPKRENGRVWIQGIPKLAWGRSGECTFAGALAAALCVTSHPYSYTRIMGYTGLAFRVRWYHRLDATEWCPSSPVGEFPDEIKAVEQATGWRFHQEVMLGSPPELWKMERFSPEIMKSIDAGLPVIGYPEDFNMGIVSGYERAENQTLFLWNAYHKPEEYTMPDTRTGPFIIILREHQESPDARDAFLQAISSNNWRRKSMPAFNPEKKGLYLLGEDALSQWAEDIGNWDKWSEEERGNLFFVSWWCFTSLLDARRQAAPFLNEHADLFEENIGARIRKAAAVFGEEARLLDDVFTSKEAFLGPWSGKGISEWTPEVRAREQETLARIRQKDAAALLELDKAIALIKSSKEE